MSYKFITILFLLLFGCRHSEVDTKSNTNQYKTWDNPISNYSSVSKSDTPKHEARLQWEMSHDRLVNNISRSKLSLIDAHRQTVIQLENLIEFHEQNRTELEIFIDRYQKLLSQTKSGLPKRIAVRKYQSLHRKICLILDK